MPPQGEEAGGLEHLQRRGAALRPHQSFGDPSWGTPLSEHKGDDVLFLLLGSYPGLPRRKWLISTYPNPPNVTVARQPPPGGQSYLSNLRN